MKRLFLFVNELTRKENEYDKEIIYPSNYLLPYVRSNIRTGN